MRWGDRGGKTIQAWSIGHREIQQLAGGSGQLTAYHLTNRPIDRLTNISLPTKVRSMFLLDTFLLLIQVHPETP